MMAVKQCILVHSLLLLGYVSAGTTTESPLPQNLECTHPDMITNGAVVNKNDTYYHGSKAEVRCDEGFRTLHNKATVFHIMCKDGKWVNVLDEMMKPPSCQRNISCPMPHIDLATLQGEITEFLPGDVAHFVCDRPTNNVNDPFATWNAFRLTCQQDGTWRNQQGTTDLPACVGRCPMPKALKHGDFNILDEVSSVKGFVPDGTKIFYFCESDYNLASPDSAIAICQLGEWVGKPAVCVEKSSLPQCPPPPAVDNAYYSMYDASGGDSSSNIVIYFCHLGYKISGEKTLRCENGAWVGEMPTCTARGDCGEPPHIQHGNYRFYRDSAGHTGMGGTSDGAQVYYQCENGYRLQGQQVPILMCKEGDWQGKVPTCEKRTHCDPPMDVPHGNWMFDNYRPYPDFRIGTRLVYECEENYKAIGSTRVECLSSGYWSDYAPRCLPQSEYCAEPGRVENGLYMCVKPSTCGQFGVGTELHYLCYSQFEPAPTDVLVQTCVAGGKWTGHTPTCSPISGSSQSDVSLELGSNTMTVVVTTSCSVLVFLLVIMVIVLLQRRVKPGHRAHASSSSSGAGSALAGMPPPPPPYGQHSEAAEMPRAITDEHDRVALIQFADGVQVVLPSYDEAVRGPGSSGGGRHPPRLSRFNSDSSHGSQRSRGEYRPLPSIPPSLRDRQQTTSGSAAPPGGERDHHRNSIITTASTTTRDNLSLAFGSMDTVNVSDGTSTSITIGTYDSGASNPSIATSQRAAAGSLTSSHTSLVNEDAPLLERSATELPPDTTVTTPIDEEPDKE